MFVGHQRTNLLGEPEDVRDLVINKNEVELTDEEKYQLSEYFTFHEDLKGPFPLHRGYYNITLIKDYEKE
jgi:hypothetical protein